VNRVERRDDISDPVLAAAMAELRGERGDVDWDRLLQSINERAALPLARRRRPQSSLFLRSLMPIALAASVAFALWLGPGVYENVFGTSSSAEFAATVDQDAILRQALGSDLSEHEFRLLVTGRSTPEVLLAVAIGDR
jgi:hypothetical protein